MQARYSDPVLPFVIRHFARDKMLITAYGGPALEIVPHR